MKAKRESCWKTRNISVKAFALTLRVPQCDPSLWDFALGTAVDTGPEPNACRRMNGWPGPQATPILSYDINLSALTFRL
jgi:hypothetical protein